MILEIDDSLDPFERKKLLEALPIRYAIENTKSRTEAAKFLGLSIRTIRICINTNHYLMDLKKDSGSRKNIIEKPLSNNDARERLVQVQLSKIVKKNMNKAEIEEIEQRIRLNLI